jgi:hypothetical protein
MISFILILLLVTFLESLLALLVSFVSRLGEPGIKIVDFCIKAPGLDLVLSLFTWFPWLIFYSDYGWHGFIACVLGQVAALYIWITLHERVHHEVLAGPRIVKTHNRLVGQWQNHVALWVSVIALPGFLFIRLMEVTVYLALVALLRFPKYDQSKWVNISRQKFTGLIGHDLIWCLYCDWMTGVYSLGAEMLRNVESFWCPIRFYDGKKCDNCKLDFPDIDGGWVPANGTLQQVTDKLETMYSGEGDRAWFGHPVRLTVKGK